MKAIFKTAIGLIFDDWWLGAGVLAAILLVCALRAAGFDAQLSGWLLSLLCAGTLMASLRAEYVRKKK